MPFFFKRQDVPTDGLHLIVGLGNPGTRYAATRHNAGAMVVEAMAQQGRLRLQSSKHAATTVRDTIQEVPVLLAIPDTFMNESGIAVSRLVHYFKVPPARLLVICDDLDIPFGSIRIRPDGGSGGHNGLKSIIAAVGTQDFPRLRMGVGRPARGAIDHVLGRFTSEEERVLPSLLALAADAVRDTILWGPSEAMNRFNRDWLSTLTPSVNS